MTLGTHWIHKQLQRTKTADTVELEVDALTSRSDFLKCMRSSYQGNLPAFHRRDIQLGHVLGHGNFAEVMEVTGITHKSSALSASSSSSSDSSTTEDEQVQVVEQASRRKYAMKQLKRKDKHDPKKFVKGSVDLAMEAKYLASFNHPNIIKVRGVSTSWATNGTTSFLLMDRLTETLDQRILRWKQDIDQTSGKLRRKSRLMEITNYALQIANAVKYVHSHRIILRDLKPANIGFQTSSGSSSSESVVQLFDFGLCRELPPVPMRGTGDDETFLMSMAGSLRYMAPEIVNSGCYGLKADVFSIAIIMFEMITLEKPFGSLCSTPSTHKRFVCQEGARPTFPANGTSTILPKNLHELIVRAWSQNATDRPSMLDVCMDLQSLINTDLKPPTANKKSSPTSSPSVPIPKSSFYLPVMKAATCA